MVEKETALDASLKIDKEQYQVRQIINSLYHNILRDYIAHANEREFYTESDVTVISKDEVRKYRELDKFVLSTSPVFINKRNEK